MLDPANRNNEHAAPNAGRQKETGIEKGNKTARSLTAPGLLPDSKTGLFAA
jgi:hypothetical protein